MIPEKDELWISVREKVWCEKRDGLVIQSNLSNNKNLQDMTLVTSKNHRNETLKKLIKKINFMKFNNGKYRVQMPQFLEGKLICIYV